MTTPVQKGEPLLPRLTADWYNSTLKETSVDAQDNNLEKRLREGELRCVCTDGTTERYKPVALTGLAAEEDKLSRIPNIDDTSTDEYNWVIPQEDLVKDGTILCVVTGLTRAWVTRNSIDDKFVTYKNGQLETAASGKALLLAYSSSEPSLITIETLASAIEIQFVIKEMTGESIANATVLEVPCGSPVVPEIDSSDCVVVKDTMGCLIMEVGMVGWASYVQKHNSSGSCYWSIKSLCCP